MDKVECVVIGAGVIGLAVARRLAQSGREVVVLEAAEGIGTVTSSRNSEVIHAGIYYKAGSLMARMCVAGKHALYRYCGEHGVPHRNCGKLIVATTPAETEKLASIRAHAQANGVLDMKVLAGDEARALEPALQCDAALLSPSTGIIDSHAYMLALRGDAEDAGAAFAFHTPLLRAKAGGGLVELETGGETPMTLACHLLVNAAGLDAPATARIIEGMPIEKRGNFDRLGVAAAARHADIAIILDRRLDLHPHPGALGKRFCDLLMRDLDEVGVSQHADKFIAQLPVGRAQILGRTELVRIDLGIEVKVSLAQPVEFLEIFVVQDGAEHAGQLPESSGRPRQDGPRQRARR